MVQFFYRPDKLTRVVGFRWTSETPIAYTGSITNAFPNTDLLVVGRDPDGELLWQVSNIARGPRRVAVGPDGTIALGYQIVGESETVEPSHFITLYDDEGKLIWNKVIVDYTVYPNEAVSSAGFRTIACDSDGNVFFIWGLSFDTLFGKLDSTTGAQLFLQDDYAGDDLNIPTGTDNAGCGGMCCDIDDNVILSYDPVAINSTGIVVRKRSGASGALIWSIAGTNFHQSPRCDGEGNIFVFERLSQSPSSGRVRKLRGTTGATMLESPTIELATADLDISIDDDNDVVWVNRTTGGAIGLRLDTLQTVSNSTINGIVRGADEDTVFVGKDTPASISGYTFKTDLNSYTEDWRVTHDFAFNAIGAFAQRFIGDVE
jgi:hypothetical protein